jgi:excisionase family DNA binding protein
MPVRYSVTAAAAAVGLSKTTVLRAIHAGFISATKTEINEWQVDPAELAEFCRRYAPVAGHSEVTKLFKTECTVDRPARPCSPSRGNPLTGWA